MTLILIYSPRCVIKSFRPGEGLLGPRAVYTSVILEAIEDARVTRVVFSDAAVVCSECGTLGVAEWAQAARVHGREHERDCDGDVRVVGLPAAGLD